MRAVRAGGDSDHVITKGPAGPAIRELSRDDPHILSGIFSSIGWNKPAQLFRRYLAECSSGQRIALVAEIDAQFAGYGTAVWHSPYVHFREQAIPEIKDLNVLPRALVGGWDRSRPLRRLRPGPADVCTQRVRARWAGGLLPEPAHQACQSSSCRRRPRAVPDKAAGGWRDGCPILITDRV